MVKHFVPAITVILLLTSCSSLKQLGTTQNQPQAPVAKEAKFINNIVVTPPSNTVATKSEPKESFNSRELEVINLGESKVAAAFFNGNTREEAISPVQIKYSILLNTEAENLQNTALLEGIDEWYGTRYRMGGTTKRGIDCSAFVGAVYAGVFGITLPRTARDQHKVTKRIPLTEVREGDLLFFNTRGGVSHVGIYLQNNKFIHASVSKGVTVDDIFDPYYIRRFVAAGRIENATAIGKSE